MKSNSATGTTGIADRPGASTAAAGEAAVTGAENSGAPLLHHAATAPASSGPNPEPRRYVGRFAPSPSGPLHFGSLVAAVGSYVDARVAGGTWLVRIEDLDPPRERAGAAQDILRTLETLGLHWDGPVLRQSSRAAAYAAALARLARRNLLHACSCSRSMLAALPENAARVPGASDELFHPARCPAPEATSSEAPGQAWRLRVPRGRVAFHDRSLGPQDLDVEAAVGNFVLRRRDGLFAYQLAVVVDDADQGVTDVVRGCDLLTSTARQILLQQALGAPPVRYLHLPLAVDDRGRKLSKSEDAPALGCEGPAGQLVAALRFLGQAPPDGLERTTPAEVLQWACAHWSVEGFAGRVEGAVAGGPIAGPAGKVTA